MNKDINWIVGFFEGEGSIGIHKVKDKRAKKEWFLLSVRVSNIQRENLLPFMFSFKGSIKPLKQIEGNKIRYQWKVVAKDAKEFLETVKPYINSQIWLEKIELSIRFQNSKCRMGHFDLNYYTSQKRFYKQMINLNKQTHG